MDISCWAAAHFSPTGAAVKFARAISSGSGCPVREADLSLPIFPELTEKDDVLLAVVPVFGGRVSKAALERLARIRGQGQTILWVGKGASVAVNAPDAAPWRPSRRRTLPM